MNLTHAARHVAALIVAAVLAGLPPSAWSARPENDSDLQPANDPYALGQKAFDAEDWQSVIDHMTTVVKENPGTTTLTACLALPIESSAISTTRLPFMTRP